MQAKKTGARDYVLTSLSLVTKSYDQPMVYETNFNSASHYDVNFLTEKCSEDGDQEEVNFTISECISATRHTYSLCHTILT